MSAPKSEPFWDEQPFRVPGIVALFVVLAHAVYRLSSNGVLVDGVQTAAAEIERLKGVQAATSHTMNQLRTASAGLEAAQITHSEVFWTVALLFLAARLVTMSATDWHGVKAWLRGVFS